MVKLFGMWHFAIGVPVDPLCMNQSHKGLSWQQLSVGCLTVSWPLAASGSYTPDLFLLQCSGKPNLLIQSLWGSSMWQIVIKLNKQ